MKAKLIPAAVILLAVVIVTQAALASTCSFTFESGGVTYHAIHHVDSQGSWFEVTDGMADTSASFDNPSAAYVAYENALYAATAAHVASCPYMHHDLGDDSAPLLLLCAGAALAAIAAVIVHRKRLGTV